MGVLNRRALFGAVPAAAALSLPVAAAAQQMSRWDEFVQGMAWGHPNGRKVAEMARDAGVDLDHLSLVILRGVADETTNHRPTLFFHPPGGPQRIFSPEGEEASH